MSLVKWQRKTHQINAFKNVTFPTKFVLHVIDHFHGEKNGKTIGRMWCIALNDVLAQKLLKIG